MEPSDWHNLIHSDPAILGGKPVVTGTRMAVRFLLDLLAAGSTEEQLIENYPSLTREGLRAALAFAADRIEEMAFYPVPAESR